MSAPPPSINRVQLMLATLRRTDLLDPEVIATIEALPAASGSDANRFARELLRRHLLTKHQLTQLARGADSQLRLGGYALLEPDGDGPAGPIFRARHRATGREVRLHRVTASDKDKLAVLHAKVDRVLDAGSFEGGYFVVEPAADEAPVPPPPAKQSSGRGVWIAASACVLAVAVAIGILTWTLSRINGLTAEVSKPILVVARQSPGDPAVSQLPAKLPRMLMPPVVAREQLPPIDLSYDAPPRPAADFPDTIAPVFHELPFDRKPETVRG